MPPKTILMMFLFVVVTHFFHPPKHSFTHLFFHSLICSFIHSSVLSFTHLFFHSLTFFFSCTCIIEYAWLLFHPLTAPSENVNFMCSTFLRPSGKVGLSYLGNGICIYIPAIIRGRYFPPKEMNRCHQNRYRQCHYRHPK